MAGTFCLVMPGSNAGDERVFFISKCTMANEKNRLKIETVKALTIVETHFKDLSCAELS